MWLPVSTLEARTGDTERPRCSTCLVFAFRPIPPFVNAAFPLCFFFSHRFLPFLQEEASQQIGFPALARAHADKTHGLRRLRRGRRVVVTPALS